MKQEGYALCYAHKPDKTKLQQIIETRHGTNWFKIREYGWVLPSNGRIDKPTCGKWLKKGCLEIYNHPVGKAWIKLYRQSCHKVSCPNDVCFMGWLNRSANKVTQRIEVSMKKMSTRKFPIHVVVSVPESDLVRICSVHEFDKKITSIRARITRLLLKVGVKGGLSIFHPFRFDKVGMLGWYFSPHFHVIGFGWVDGKKVKSEFERTGYTVKNLGVRKTSGEIFSTIRYLLSHAGVKVNKINHRHTVSWFGKLSNRSMPNWELEIEDEEDNLNRCGFCNKKLKPIEEATDRPPPDGEYVGSDDASVWKYEVIVDHRKI